MSDTDVNEPKPTPHEKGESTPIDEEVAALVRERRTQLGWDVQSIENADRWGLALSGGGIRSATFCFGLLKALAQNEVFNRFDLMSTVSGGGYIGATVGKLFQNADGSPEGAKKIEQALADADARWFGFWLRANGRYLIPNGAKDTMFAVANFARNLVGVHIELALMGLLLGCVLVGFDLAIWQWADCLFSGNSCWQPDWVSMSTLDTVSRFPTVWMFLPPLMVVVATLAVAYWVLPSDASVLGGVPVLRWFQAVLAAAFFMALVKYGPAWSSTYDAAQGPLVPGWLLLVAGGLSIGMVGGIVLACLVSMRRSTSSERSHHSITRRLAYAISAALLVMGLGLVDMVAWQLAKASMEYMVMSGASIGLTVAVLRAVLPKIADLPKSLTPGSRKNIGELINAAGLAVLVMAVIFWVSVVHRGVTMGLFRGQVLDFKFAWLWLLVIAVPVFLLMAFSFTNRDFLNRSSLFSFYRARLVRSYLGAGNAARSGRLVAGATDQYPRDWAGGESGVRIEDVHSEDDVPMKGYAPHARGGPVHLINACINQTRDPRGGMFNQDRKGQLITVGPFGRVRVGLSAWKQVSEKGSMTLGSWLAISGAAVAPGLGSSTKAGISALLTLSGVRLGYWWNTLSLERDADEPVPRHFNKYAQLLAELRGRFEGTHRMEWFLSDGGHYENTAAYALLREECKLVVVADCGADPRYAFGDLENLVRKARIDLQATITFRKPRLYRPPTTAVSDAVPSPLACAAPPAFGSLNDLVSSESQACLALARVEYRSGKRGYIIVVKPNIVAGAPVDLVNFKADHPLFPQEPTTDQFFSEAQWESYFLLGKTLGLHLTPELLGNLPHMDSTCFEEDDGNVTLRDAEGVVHSATAPKRLPSRIAATGAVTASVSLGALATLGATVWQAIDHHIDERTKAREVDKTVLKELTDLYGRALPGTFFATPSPLGTRSDTTFSPSGETKAPTYLGEMATALLRVGHSCKPGNAQAYRSSVLIQMILRDTSNSCAQQGLAHPSCAELLNEDNSSIACLLPPKRLNCEPRYWARDYVPSGGGDADCGKSMPSAWLGGLMSQKTAMGSVTGSVNAINKGKPAEEPGSPVGSEDPKINPTPASTGSIAIEEKKKDIPPTEGACKGKTVYIQIFGPELRDTARLLREPWRKLGASVPPIEDVLDTARRRGSSALRAQSAPTAIYHDAASKECALQLRPPNIVGDWEVSALPQRFTGVPGVIEVWLPPGSLRIP